MANFSDFEAATVAAGFVTNAPICTQTGSQTGMTQSNTTHSSNAQSGNATPSDSKLYDRQVQLTESITETTQEGYQQRSSTYQILQIPREHLVALWPCTEPHIARALGYCLNCYEPVDILMELLEGKLQLWVAWNNAPALANSEKDYAASIEAAMVTRLVAYPRRRSCQVFLIGGKNLSQWSNLFLTAIESYARANHCNFLEGGARRGWIRVGGFKQFGTSLYKEI